MKKLVLEEWIVHPHQYTCFYDCSHLIYYMIFIISPILLLFKFKFFDVLKRLCLFFAYNINLSRMSNPA